RDRDLDEACFGVLQGVREEFATIEPVRLERLAEGFEEQWVVARQGLGQGELRGYRPARPRFAPLPPELGLPELHVPKLAGERDDLGGDGGPSPEERLQLLLG